MSGSFEQRLAEKYDVLSRRLREAGDYVAENPVNTATRSLRSVATEAGLAPATFSRLARVLNYDSFEQVREVMRRKIDRRVNSFADKADRLQSDHKSGKLSFLGAHNQACQKNLQAVNQGIDEQQLIDTVDRLHKSRKVLIMGTLGSTGIAEYMSYMANFLMDNWIMAGRMGASLGSGLAGLDDHDALIIITKPPFARRSLLAAEVARQNGAFVVVITDSRACPALRHAQSSFLVETESPHFYSSYVATIFLVEAMIGMLASRLGPDAMNRIAEVESKNRRLGEVCDH